MHDFLLDVSLSQIFKGSVAITFIFSMIYFFKNHDGDIDVELFGKSFGFAAAISGLIPVLFIIVSYIYLPIRILLNETFGDTAYLVSSAVAIYFAYKNIKQFNKTTSDKPE